MIETKDLCLQLGKFSLKNINLTIGDREYFVVLGPTGAGKTVFLECIAGLHRVSGEILVDGKRITRLPPEERYLGYVPQDYVLFPFLNVAENIGFALKLPKGQISARVKELALLLGISQLLDRNTRSLSGGERQRVALARALALSPRILLLDEPLASLDLQTSKHLRLELRRIHRELGVTTLHITHNHVEAEELADRMAVLNMGKLEQVGKPQQIFFYPQNEIVSDFIGALNILECDSCHSLGQGLMEVNCHGLHVVLPHDEGPIKRIALFPRDVYVSDTPPPGPQVNRFKGTITSIRPTGASVRLEVRAGENTLRAEMLNDIFEEMDLKIGQEVYLILKLRRLRVYDGRL